MANRTINLYAEAFGYVDGREPYQTHPVSGNQFCNVEAYRTSGRILYVQFEQMPDALKRKRLVSIGATFRARCKINSDLYAGGTLKIKELANKGDSFDPDTITYANAPELYELSYHSEVIYGGISPVTREYTVNIHQQSDILVGDFFSKNRILAFASDYSGHVDSLEISTRLADGTTPLYVTITYDDADDIEPLMWLTERSDFKVDPVRGWTVDCASFRFGGRVPAVSADNTWTIKSIELYYKVVGASDYIHVHADADDLYNEGVEQNYAYLFQPYVLDAGKEYEWYTVITDTEDNVWRPMEVMYGAEEPRYDGIAYFWTTDLVLRWGRYPTGTIYNTVPLNVSWYLTTENNYVDVNQNVVNFNWRAEGETNYHVYSYTGTPKEMFIPAYTFPSGKTIEYYLSATAVGYTAFTAAASFRTYSYSLQAYEFPQGNKVCSGDVLNFTYTLQTGNSVDVLVSESTLYWRESTSGSYSTVTNTSAEKAVHVPAETFDTGMSVQWYLFVTAADGTVYTTSPKTFTTATSQITPQSSPTSGYTDPRNPILFSWFFAAGDGSVTGTASLFWKVSTSSTYTEETTTGNSITIPANTFPVASVIEWYISGTDYSGQASQTEVFSFSTEAGTAYAVCVAPVGRVEDGSKPITFEWSVINEDGTAPTRILLEWKYDVGSTWNTILDTTSIVYEYTVPEKYFSAGAIDWRVSAWNRDGVKGAANQASFVCMLAPDAPSGLRATTVPRTTVSWQSEAQEAYEITIDGVVEAKQYGVGVYSWQREEPLEDGVHTIEVRVQGAYGLWSDYATTSIDVVNVPFVGIDLSGQFDVDALLTWEYDDTIASPKPNVYRDGVRIAYLDNVLEFTDRFAIGDHEYYVTLWDGNGYYSKSNTVVGTMESNTARIADVNGGEWLALKMTESEDTAETFQWSKSYALQNVRGASYPIIEIGNQEEASGSYSCAFQTPKEAKKLEDMRGKQVVVKSKKQNVIIGVLTNLQKQAKPFYISYSFSIQQIHWGDFIDQNT